MIDEVRRSQIDAEVENLERIVTIRKQAREANRKRIEQLVNDCNAWISHPSGERVMRALEELFGAELTRDQRLKLDPVDAAKLDARIAGRLDVIKFLRCAAAGALEVKEARVA